MMHDRKTGPIARLIGLAMILSLFVLAACGGGQDEAPAGPSQVEVLETEFALELSPASVPAGEVIFMIKNEGALEHNFIVEGIDDMVELVLPQETQELKVNLSSGTYRLLCNLPGHEEAGMVGEIVVE